MSGTEASKLAPVVLQPCLLDAVEAMRDVVKGGRDDEMTG